MTFGELKNLVTAKLNTDGATYLTTGSADYEAEVKAGLNDYVLFTRMNHVDRSLLSTTLTAGSSSIDLRPISLVRYPTALWIDGKWVHRADSLAGLREDPTLPALPEGQPTQWAPSSTPGVIRINTRLTTAIAAQTDHTVSGWAIHPTIVSDGTVLLVPDEQRHELAEHIAVHFMRPVVTDPAAIERLQGYAANAAIRMESHRALNLRRYME